VKTHTALRLVNSQTDRVFSITHIGDRSVCRFCLQTIPQDLEVTWDTFPHREDCEKARQTMETAVHALGLAAPLPL